MSDTPTQPEPEPYHDPDPEPGVIPDDPDAGEADATDWPEPADDPADEPTHDPIGDGPPADDD